MGKMFVVWIAGLTAGVLLLGCNDPSGIEIVGPVGTGGAGGGEEEPRGNECDDEGMGSYCDGNTLVACVNGYVERGDCSPGECTWDPGWEGHYAHCGPTP